MVQLEVLGEWISRSLGGGALCLMWVEIDVQWVELEVLGGGT